MEENKGFRLIGHITDIPRPLLPIDNVEAFDDFLRSYKATRSRFTYTGGFINLDYYSWTNKAVDHFRKAFNAERGEIGWSSGHSRHLKSGMVAVVEDDIWVLFACRSKKHNLKGFKIQPRNNITAETLLVASKLNK